jgi:hypothetical protein
METKIRKIEKRLKYHFTKEERDALAGELSQVVQECEEKEAAKKGVMAQLNAELEQSKTTMRVVAGKHRDGFEYRPIPCEERRDFALKIVTIERLDTGEMIEERKMRPEELQGELYE